MKPLTPLLSGALVTTALFILGITSCPAATVVAWGDSLTYGTGADNPLLAKNIIGNGSLNSAERPSSTKVSAAKAPAKSEPASSLRKPKNFGRSSP